MTTVPPLSAGGRIHRPTLQTRFHIDEHWWQENGKDLESFRREICQRYHVLPAEPDLEKQFDWVDSETAAIQRISHADWLVRTYCANQPDFISDRDMLVDALLRALIANGNQPLSINELADRIKRPQQAKTILQLLSARQVYNGLRPVLE
jgi:hypothetical protein